MRALYVGLAWACAAWGAISSTPVQQAVADNIAAAISVTMGSTPTNGNVLVALIASNVNSQTVSGIVQTGVTWHLALRTQTNETIECWYGEVGSGASTAVAITLSGSVTFRANVSEWSGLATSGEADANSGSNGTSATPTTASITPTSGRNILVVASTRKANTFTAGSETNGFTTLTTSNAGWRYSYLVVSSSSGSYSTGWTFNISSAWEALIASFLAPAVGGGVQTLTLMGAGK